MTFIQGHQLLGLENEQNELYFFISDGLGSVRVVVDSDGNAVGEFNHDEFGRQEASTAAPGLSAHSYVGSLGVRNDTATSGLLYMQQRYYDPGLGRFLNQDPIGFEGGLNLFGYVNPVNSVDPSGLGPEIPPGWDQQFGGNIYRYSEDGHGAFTDSIPWVPLHTVPYDRNPATTASAGYARLEAFWGSDATKRAGQYDPCGAEELEKSERARLERIRAKWDEVHRKERLGEPIRPDLQPDTPTPAITTTTTQPPRYTTNTTMTTQGGQPTTTGSNQYTTGRTTTRGYPTGGYHPH